MRIGRIECITAKLLTIKPNQAIRGANPDKAGGVLGKRCDNAIVDTATVTNGFEIGIVGRAQFKAVSRCHAREHESHGAQKVLKD